MKHVQIRLLVLYCLSLPLYTAAQWEDPRIFGKVITVDNDTVTGYFLWNDNKMYWTDLFKASKFNNPYAHYFKNSSVVFKQNGALYTTPITHLFLCRFGNINKIYPTGDNKLRLEMKDGSLMELRQENNMPFSFQMVTNEGKLQIRWDKICEIEFTSPPLLDNRISKAPIIGVVKSNQGLYKGYISWNNISSLEENIAGKSLSGNNLISFHNIRKITKKNNQCNITLNNGKEVEIQVASNINIVVNMPHIGVVTIPWKNFEFLETVGQHEIDMLSYEDFTPPRKLSGKVITRNGETISGTLAYDLDETMDFELLDGKNDNNLYQIPFKYIQSIEPKNYKYSLIKLRNGTTLSLGDLCDVNEENNGIIVFSPESIPTYIPWEKVKQVFFY